MLSGWEPLESQCYDGHGLVFNGGQPSAMDDGIVHRPNPNINILECVLILPLAMFNQCWKPSYIIKLPYNNNHET